MKVVIDTNVLVSGVFFVGVPFRVLEAWRDGRIHMVVSPDNIEEYRRVGERLAEHFEGVTLGAFLAIVINHAEIVEPARLSGQVARDPEDDKFIACAMAAGCRYIISGDRDLLDVGEHAKVKIVTPRELLDCVVS
jgi:uncharacterized protein